VEHTEDPSRTEGTQSGRGYILYISSSVRTEAFEAHLCGHLGVQEALVRQVQDLQELLGDDWAWVRSSLIVRSSRHAHHSSYSRKV
jgi:hypothetical protein